MKILLDTHILLWAGEPDRLPAAALEALENPQNELIFSPASLWEIAIKTGLDREDFKVDTRLIRRGLLDNGYVELPVTGEHVVAVVDLPPIHKDPYDRMLIAQATICGIELMTADEIVSRYPGRSVEFNYSRTFIVHHNSTE
ncbi:PIN domain nuclease of toxin-antitoxin system [Devosia sp. UYZn731]|uniref:type II toxin-antitoxin system VapC family toxin n=1 Tax=Devosia sp. UYZn731 TaxID=3156345 RepID=UPI003394DE76